MKIKVDLYSAIYAPLEEGADEREKIYEQSATIPFDNATECAHWLKRNGFDTPSVDPGPYDRRTWLSQSTPYEDLESGVLTEQTAALATDPEFNPRLWAAIVASVTRQWTHYRGPYYVERVNVFGVKL